MVKHAQTIRRQQHLLFRLMLILKSRQRNGMLCTKKKQNVLSAIGDNLFIEYLSLSAILNKSFILLCE